MHKRRNRKHASVHGMSSMANRYNHACYKHPKMGYRSTWESFRGSWYSMNTWAEGWYFSRDWEQATVHWDYIFPGT